LEFAEQVERGECEMPERIVVPLGTGGTAAGLALGLCLAGINARIIGVRVVPRIVGNAARVRNLAHAGAALIERTTGEVLPRLGNDLITVEHGYFGSAYARPLPTNGSESALDDFGVVLDDTYSRKAFAAAMADRSRSTLLWLTFDGRLMRADPEDSE
jgi:D-cysteine desulfhydrase